MTRTISAIPKKRAHDFFWNETQGRIISCWFTKKNGEMRYMKFRRGVKKHLRGGSLPYSPKPKNLLPVFDMTIGEYRMVNLETLVSFNVGQETFILS